MHADFSISNQTRWHKIIISEIRLNKSSKSNDTTDIWKKNNMHQKFHRKSDLRKSIK